MLRILPSEGFFYADSDAHIFVIIIEGPGRQNMILTIYLND